MANKARPIDRSLTLTILSGYNGSLAEFILYREAAQRMGVAKSIKARTNMALYM